jgi:hypothetical protein
MEYLYTLNLQIQANRVEDLMSSIDEVRRDVEKGYGLSNEMSSLRRYALSIEKESDENRFPFKKKKPRKQN